VDDVRIERTGVKTKLGTTLLKGDKETPAVIAEDFRVAKPGETRREAMGDERAYLVTDRKSRDAQTQFGALERQLRLMIKRGKNGEALTEKELEMVLKLIAELPGRREGRDELSLYVAQMILKVDEEGFEGKTDRPEDVWEEFKKGKNIEELGEEHPEMWLVYEYIEIHGKDPSQVDWREVSTYGKALAAISKEEQIPEEVLREIADKATYGIDANTSDDDAQKIRDDLYQKLLAKEGYDSTNKTAKKWKNNGVKERAFSLWLGLRHEDVIVDVERYWKRERLLPIVEKRLGRMRSQAVARLKEKPGDETGDEAMMEITKPKELGKDEYWKGYNSALALEDVASKTLLGRYLDEMGKGTYWRGKAKLDHAYLSLYMGILIDHPESAMKSGKINVFAKMGDTLGDHVRSYTGVQAIYEMAQDERVIDVLNRLYFLTDKSYEKKLEDLAKDYKFDPKGDLPDFVTDAVMMEKVFMMDIKNMYTSDRRQQIIDPAGFYLKKAVTYGEKTDEGLYRVVEMMGNHFKFCEGILMKMGFVSAMNIKEEYHAIVPDEDREFKPEEYQDQKDLIWKYMFMFALQLRTKPLRRAVIKTTDRVNFKVPPGLVGDFMVYTNDRQKNGVFDHREEVFKRFVKVLEEDEGLIDERNRGKAGWDMDLIERGGVTVREAVKKMIEDFGEAIDVTIDGVEIQTNGNEIFYNDEVAELLVRYEEYEDAGGKGNAEFDNNLEMLKSLLNLRNVLRDHRAWGLVWSIDEPEVMDRLEMLKDFDYAERYIHGGGEAKKNILELVNADPFQGLEEMKLTPDSVLKTFSNMGHRLLGHLYERNFFKLMAFAEMVVLTRAGQLEIPDAKTLRQMIDPGGETRVGTVAVSRALKEGGKVPGSEAHGAIWDQMRELGYMEKLVQLRLMLINVGFYKRWDDAVSAEAKRLLIAEAFTWAMTRDLPLKQEAWIYDELAAYLEPELPVESYHVVDALVRGGEDSPPEFQITDMGIQSLNGKQIELFFRPINEQQAGDMFGGVRVAVVQTAGGGVGIKAGASEEASGVVDNKGNAVLVVGGQVAVFQIWRGWAKVGVTRTKGRKRRWIEAGWLRLDEIQELDFVDQEKETEGFARQGERMHQGSRFVWSVKKKRWDSVLGEWRLDRNSNRMFFYKEGSKWIVKKLTDKQKASGDPYNDQGKVKGFKRELRLGGDQINPKTGETEEANFPYLVFKSEAHRKKFFDERMRMIFSLMFGRARKALKGGQAKVPLSGVLYEKEEAALSDITRGGYEVQTMMRYMERKNACRAALVKMLAEYFGVKPVSATVLESYMESYDLVMRARIWGEDREAVVRFIKELSAIQLFKKELLTKKGALSRAEKIRIQLSNVSLKLLMKAVSLETSLLGIPINVVFGAMLVIPQVLGTAIPIIDTMVTNNVFAQALKGIDIWRKVGLLGLELAVATWGAHQIKRWLIGQVKVDVAHVVLDDIPYLNEFKAHVPVP